MALCLVKAQGHFYLYIYLLSYDKLALKDIDIDDHISH
jgi:hypothetical protein